MDLSVCHSIENTGPSLDIMSNSEEEEEEASKKRDYNEDKKTVEEEKSKKVRIHESSWKEKEQEDVDVKKLRTTQQVKATDIDSRANNRKRLWDLESALLHLVQIEMKEKEFLTNDKLAWVTFRVGHAGDASTIANWYRQEKQIVIQDRNPELKKKDLEGNGRDGEDATSSMLEVWLADGMGDEGNPPSLFSLVANVQQVKDLSETENSSDTQCTKSIGAVALMTVSFADDERVLRIEWTSVNRKLPREIAKTLEQRLWLRLSTLSVMTACQAVVVDRQFISSPRDTKPFHTPSAE